jgi:hypothetical protein
MDGLLWSEARDALADVAELSRIKGGECLDIYCLNNPKYRHNLRVSRLLHAQSLNLSFTRLNRKSVTSSTILSQKVIICAVCIYITHTSTGQTPIGHRLRQVLDFYVPKIEDPTLRHKPISILVITDGVPSKSFDEMGGVEQ